LVRLDNRQLPESFFAKPRTRSLLVWAATGFNNCTFTEFGIE
jgi:hypothetical protein